MARTPSLPAAGSSGIGADPGHHEHRRPSTIVPTEASGSIARLIPQPGQKTSSQGVSATSAALTLAGAQVRAAQARY